MSSISPVCRLTATSDNTPPYRLGQTVSLVSSPWDWPSDLPRWANTPCRVGVFLQLQEPKTCLVVSAFNDPSHPLDAKGAQRPLEDHITSLERTETYDRVFWFSETDLRFFWHRDRLQRASVSPGRDAFASLYRTVGHPEGDGEWLAIKLLPRTRPSLLRFVTPQHIQWFIGL